MHFGPDGRLYIAVGDNANGNNAQVLTNLLGKMLRINKDGSIPGDNPFVTQPIDVNDAIWAIGLRNPFTFSFDPGSAGCSSTMWGRTPGRDQRRRRGCELRLARHRRTDDQPCLPIADLLVSAQQATVTGCAITGGTFYSGVPQIFPASYAGDYFFADYCSGWINQLNEAHTRVTPTFATEVAAFPVDLKAGPDGALYYLSRVSGGSTALSGASCSPDRRRRQSARTRRTSRPPSGSPRPSRSSHLARPRSRINGRGMAPSPGRTRRSTRCRTSRPATAAASSASSSRTHWDRSRATRQR